MIGVIITAIVGIWIVELIIGAAIAAGGDGDE